MKIVTNIFVLLLVLLVGAGCSGKRTNISDSNSSPVVTKEQTASVADIESKQTTGFEPFFKIEDESTIKIKLTGFPDYMFATPKQLYKNVDLIVIGSFLKNNGAFVKQYGRIMTNAEVRAEKVMKGNANVKEISAVLYGGSVPLLDYYNSYDEGSQKKMNIDLSSIKPTDLVQGYQGKDQAYPLIGKRYLLFFNKIDEENKYFLSSDSYGMLEIKDDMYFDRITEKWANIAELFKD